MQEKISKQIINERPEAIRVGGDIGGANRLQCCSFCACCGEKEKQNFYFTHHKQNRKSGWNFHPLDSRRLNMDVFKSCFYSGDALS